jgi:hypothetical protein
MNSARSGDVMGRRAGHRPPPRAATLVCGSIGHLPIGEIEPTDVLTAIRRIEGKGKLESARRSLQRAGAVFRYAVATARLASDPTRDLRGALTAPTVTHYGAITDPKKVGELLRASDDYEGSGITKLALQVHSGLTNCHDARRK